MAKAKEIPTTLITETYTFNSEKNKVWRYDCKDSEVVGSLYLSKKKWPKKPGDKVNVKFEIEGDA